MTFDPQTIRILMSEPVQEVLCANQTTDPAAFALAYQNSALPVQAIAAQLAARHKAQRKLPTLSQHPLLYESRALEQCSGEMAAQYKASLVKGRVCIDLSGGLGIDSIFLARRFGHLHYYESDLERSELFRTNCATLGITNVTIHTGESLGLLSALREPVIDLIYVDPSRRDTGGKRMHDVRAGTPNVVKAWEQMRHVCPQIMVKASPLFDADEALRILPGLSRCIYVSVSGECRELLLIADQGHCGPPVIGAAVLGTNNSAGELWRQHGQSGSFTCAAIENGSFLFDPDPSLRAARLGVTAAQRYNLQPVNSRIDYLVGTREVPGFPGRTYRIHKVMPFSRKTVKAYLRAQNIDGASIAARGSAVGPERYRTLLGLRESAREYLVFVTTEGTSPLCIHARPVQPQRDS